MALGTLILSPGTAVADAGGDPNSGREVFVGNCAACHGPAAQGAGNAPALPGVVDQLGADRVAETIRDGRNGMPAFGGRLDEAEIGDVVAYLEQLPTSEQADRDRSGRRMMDGRGRDMMDGWPVAFGWLWLVVGLLLIALLVLGLVWLARSLARGTSEQSRSAAPGGSLARETLDQRYARGEITREQYLQARDDLEGGPGRRGRP
jgi:mono/diheme cytochrome c family protein